MSASPNFDDPRPIPSSTRRVVPAWVGSMLLHCGLVLLMAITIKSVPRGAAEEDDRTTGIVLKHVDDAGEYYEGEQDNVDAATEAAATAASDASAIAAALPNPNENPLDVSSFLPSATEGLGPPAGEIGGGGNLDLAGAAPGNRNIEGGKGRTGVFGLSGEGYNFVYVFDASASMSSYEGRPLAAAKRELVASVQHLARTHRFHIIFYNEKCQIFEPGIPGKLFFATDDNKKAAERFVNSVEARLSTDHLPALLTAVDMGADVIFFLTDGEDPALSSVELDQIARQNAGRSAIQVIQFGSSSPSQDNWLMRLARQNGGQYKFFDIHRLSPRD